MKYSIMFAFGCGAGCHVPTDRPIIGYIPIILTDTDSDTDYADTDMGDTNTD